MVRDCLHECPLCCTVSPVCGAVGASATRSPLMFRLACDGSQTNGCCRLQHSNSNAVLSMRIGKHEECTILVSKNNNKYRLQGTSYKALWLPLVELVQRVKTFFAEGSGMELSLELEEDIPLQHLMFCIDNHFALRQKRKHVVLEIEQAAAQVWHARGACHSSRVIDTFCIGILAKHAPCACSFESPRSACSQSIGRPGLIRSSRYVPCWSTPMMPSCIWLTP